VRRYDAVMADLNSMAHRIVKEHTEPSTPTAAQVSGKKGGLKGGKARSERLTAEQRSDVARKAAQTRWAAKNSPA
jgi:hypothetical protein